MLPLLLFFYTATAPPEFYTLSLHDALPISSERAFVFAAGAMAKRFDEAPEDFRFATAVMRSEEHTSELQSRFDLVCRLLLEKKKNDASMPPDHTHRSYCTTTDSETWYMAMV